MNPGFLVESSFKKKTLPHGDGPMVAVFSGLRFAERREASSKLATPVSSFQGLVGHLGINAPPSAGCPPWKDPAHGPMD